MDLGCNAGGMLHAISGQIGKGYGFDFNPNCINAAQLIKTLNQTGNLEFYVFDLDKQSLSLLSAFLFGQRVDICFLLSVCMWIERWREVVRLAAKISDCMLFESNGSVEQQKSQVELLESLYQRMEVISESSKDDFSCNSRTLYFCSSPRTANLQSGNVGELPSCSQVMYSN